MKIVTQDYASCLNTINLETARVNIPRSIFEDMSRYSSYNCTTANENSSWFEKRRVRELLMQ